MNSVQTESSVILLQFSTGDFAKTTFYIRTWFLFRPRPQLIMLCPNHVHYNNPLCVSLLPAGKASEEGGGVPIGPDLGGGETGGGEEEGRGGAQESQSGVGDYSYIHYIF